MCRARVPIILVGLLPLMITLSGCWDRTEVNDLALVMGAALDKHEQRNDYELSVQIYIPKEEGVGDSNNKGAQTSNGEMLVTSAYGTTIADAMSALQEELSRRLFWGHTDVVIFGEKVAEEGIGDHLDFLLRLPQTRGSIKTFVSKGEAKKMLELVSPIERSSVEALRELAKSKTGMDTTIVDLSQMLTEGTNAAILPWIESLPSKLTPVSSSFPYIHGTAVFKKDKMVGKIENKATKGILILRNELSNTVITIKLKNGKVSFFLVCNKTDFTPQIARGIWSITARIYTEANVIQNTTDLDLSKPDINLMLEQKLQAEIQNIIEKALGLAQKKFNADLFNFADVFHRKYPIQWKHSKQNWEDIFHNIKVETVISTKIRRPGMITSNGSKMKEEIRK